MNSSELRPHVHSAGGIYAFALLAGVSPRAVAYWLKDERKMRGDSLGKVRKAVRKMKRRMRGGRV